MNSTSHKQHLFGLFFFSFKAKGDSYRPKYTSSVIICSNLNGLQTFKISSWKNIFLQCSCYRCNLIRWMFFVPRDSWKALFFLKVYRYCEIFTTAVLSFSFKQVFWKMSVIYAIGYSALLILMLMLSSTKSYRILYL